MKIKKSEIVNLFVALGYPKASDWDDVKLRERASKLPTVIPEPPANLEEGLLAIYNDIANSPQDEEIELIDEKGRPIRRVPPPEDPTKETRALPPAEKKKLKTKPPTPKPPKPQAPRDPLGNRIGSISAKVNAQVSSEWKDEHEIARDAKVTIDQARGRLYYGTVEKVFEMRRRVEYRLVQKPAEKK